MVDANTTQIINDCYVKIVEEIYYDREAERVIPKIYLRFRSKHDYKKINKIEKMIEKYNQYKCEGEKEFIVYHYLNKIIKYLRECKVMKVFFSHDLIYLIYCFII